ncbi:unnamed protein product [Vitrella brassicaformis CCMP3155]|uniref:Uncharacterized protein n=1 Tax=Vitrella brassicaformis (strain CCMP3155) TaxID=1169540 RepID=A0A0G4G0A4_VITBC|nr:unnamed protein product [Vitrella brassicaformis CCMP3155]|eukprot:CEM21286.1 unnamed protein product [Vitrella brassicaformis CCMP3155]
MVLGQATLYSQVVDSWVAFPNASGISEWHLIASLATAAARTLNTFDRARDLLTSASDLSLFRAEELSSRDWSDWMQMRADLQTGMDFLEGAANVTTRALAVSSPLLGPFLTTAVFPLRGFRGLPMDFDKGKALLQKLRHNLHQLSL